MTLMLYEEKGELASPLLFTMWHTIRKGPSENQEVFPHQTPDLLGP